MALLYNGLLLMIAGMGTVFIFLSLMVGCIQASSKLSAKFAHLLPEKKPARRPKRPAPPAAPEQDGVLMAVIAAAVQKYRADQAGAR